MFGSDLLARPPAKPSPYSERYEERDCCCKADEEDVCPIADYGKFGLGVWIDFG
jgi:hypothetical protein